MVVGLSVDSSEGFFEVFSPPDVLLDVFMLQQVAVLLDEFLSSDVAVLVKESHSSVLFMIVSGSKLVYLKSWKNP